jgi:hypothetical protein
MGYRAAMRQDAAYLDAAYAHAYYDHSRGDLNIDLVELEKKLEQLPPGKGRHDPKQLIQESLTTYIILPIDETVSLAYVASWTGGALPWLFVPDLVHPQ